jgi:hypothetical protein
MVLLRHVADDERSRKRLHALHLDSLDQWPATLSGIAPPFGLLLVCDAAHVSSSAVGTAAEQALASGAAYVVAWGSDCERVHDVFDEAYVLMRLERPDLLHVMTTWHADESLDEALWFFVDVTQLPKQTPKTDWLAVSVGRSDWSAQIRRRLADPAGLRAAIERSRDETPR